MTFDQCFLVIQASASRSSTYLAGYLYHDLSERLCAGGRIIEVYFILEVFSQFLLQSSNEILIDVLAVDSFFCKIITM